MKFKLNIILFYTLFSLLNIQLFSQDLTAARYEIDAKRIGVSPIEKDALPRSREFLRLDSTYYVGWMYDGMYKFERSSDYLGYQLAIKPLRKALYLLEKDFAYKLKNLYSSYSFFQQNASRFDDFFMIANTLKSCYNSIEMPDSTMHLLEKIEAYHFQKDFFSVQSDRAWIFHRNRFFKKENHPFLKNSVEENEKMAFHYCYKQIEEISRNKTLNDYWYGNYQSEEDYLTVYHYLALLHNYNRRYDSAEYYYNLLAQGGRISWSNYGNMMHEVGHFADAITYYKKPQYRSRFALEEADYYLPLMLIYGAKTKEAIRISAQKIAQSPSTPGFGWYTIGLARGYLYDGQLDSCEFYLNKAANFKELHINTTLTQSQYEFTINLLRIQLLDRKINLIQFLNTGWWYNVSDWYNIILVKIEKLMLEYNVVNALANNPERTRVVYDLFCAETTVTYDESMYLLKDFSLPYFRKMYASYAKYDIRKRINPYFRYFEAKFKLEDGEEEDAVQIAQEILRECLPSNIKEDGETSFIDVENEKLLLARIYEIIANATDDENLKANSISKIQQYYPQLLAFSEMQAEIYLEYSGLEDEMTEKVKKELKKANVNWTNNIAAYKARVNFEKKGGFYTAGISVLDEFGNEVVQDGRIVFKDPNLAGKEIVLRILGKGGAVQIE
ncbi:MAG: hypothetical protein IPM51_10790 [Sphingobacteriaceae bacterium]|nr:hypothetical protein [Sphingobacteriaceae bacterium]